MPVILSFALAAYPLRLIVFPYLYLATRLIYHPFVASFFPQFLFPHHPFIGLRLHTGSPGFFSGPVHNLVVYLYLFQYLGDRYDFITLYVHCSLTQTKAVFTAHADTIWLGFPSFLLFRRIVLPSIQMILLITSPSLRSSGSCHF